MSTVIVERDYRPHVTREGKPVTVQKGRRHVPVMLQRGLDKRVEDNILRQRRRKYARRYVWP